MACVSRIQRLGVSGVQAVVWTNLLGVTRARVPSANVKAWLFAREKSPRCVSRVQMVAVSSHVAGETTVSALARSWNPRKYGIDDQA